MSQEGAVIGHGERREHFLDDLAAQAFEDALEAGSHFVAVGDVVGDQDHALPLQGLGAVIGHGMGALRRGRGGAGKPGVGLALGHVFGGSHREGRDLLLGDVVVDRQRLEGSQRPDQHMNFVFLDQFLGLGASSGRHTTGIGHDQFDLAPGQGVVALFQVHDQGAFHVDAARRQGSGLDRDQANAHGAFGLGLDDGGHAGDRKSAHSTGSLNQSATRRIGGGGVGRDVVWV